MNQIYQQMNPKSGTNNIIQRFQQFKNSFRGDPQQQVQQLLNSEKVSQQQYDQAVQMTNQLKQMMGM